MFYKIFPFVWEMDSTISVMFCPNDKIYKFILNDDYVFLVTLIKRQNQLTVFHELGIINNLQHLNCKL